MLIKFICNSFSSESKQQLRKVSAYGDVGSSSPNLPASKASHLPFGLSPHCVKLSRRYFGQSAIMSFFRNRSAYRMKRSSFSAEIEKQLGKV